MAVSNYIRGCGYGVNKLDKVVYLFSESIVKDIRVDNGAAYVTLSSNPIGYAVNSVSVEDTSSLDERYAFSHRVQFSVNGYANENFVDNKYYVAVKTVGGAYYILNPRIPCKVQYTFTLGNDECHTDFTMDTVSNDATLPLSGLSLPTPRECGFYLDGMKSLKLNEARYTKMDGNVICYTNDGFKDVDLGMDAVFTESFDGEVMTHRVSFTIPMTTYKQSWHYNLLEFQANTYCAIIESKSGRVYTSGFGYGLQPSYTLNGNSTDSAYIDISLEAVYDTEYARYTASSMDELEIGVCEGFTWEYVLEDGTYECVAFGLAKYLLKRQLDELGNPTGLYMCLYGYEDRFPHLQIIGTFDDIVIFESDVCKYPPESGGTLPSSVTFNDYTCKTYTFSANCDWNASSQYSGITFRPTSGEANILYDVEICNNNTWTGGTLYRWAMTSDIICDGYNAYYAERYQYSNDGGSVWHNTDIERYGALVEEDSAACGYDAGMKWIAYNTKDDLFGEKCEGGGIGYGTTTSGTVKEVRIGECVEITENFFTGKYNSTYDTSENSSIRRIVYPNSLRRIGQNSFNALLDPNYMPTIEFPNTIYVIGNNVLGSDTDEPSIGLGFSSDSSKAFDIVIPNSVKVLGRNIFMCRGDHPTSVRNITIGNGVTSIGQNSFDIASSEDTLEDVVIGNSISFIDENAFGSLIPKSVTIHATTPPVLGDNAFNKSACPFFVPSGSVESYKSAESWARFKDMIFPIGSSIFTTAKAYSFFGILSNSGVYRKNVITAREDGSGVLKLSEIVNSDFELTSVATIYVGDSVREIINDITTTQAAYNLHHLVFSPNSQLVKFGDYSFGENQSISHTRIYNFPSNVEYIGDYAFEGCILNIDGTYLSNIEYIGNHAFYHSNLRDITINNTSSLIIGNEAFGYYAGDIYTPDIMPIVRFTSDVMPRFCGAMFPSHRVTQVSIGDVTGTCINGYLYVPFDSVDRFANAVSPDYPYNRFRMVLPSPNSYPTVGEYVVEPSTVVIPENYFSGNSGLVGTYIIPSSVTTIGAAAFYDCDNINGIIIEDGSSLTSMEVPYGKLGAFDSCSKLTSVVFPETMNLTEIKRTFSGCGRLRSVRLPNSLTNIDDYTFSHCGSLASITIPSGVTNIGDWAFHYCTSLSSITIPSGVTSIGEGAFGDCSGLTSITLPNGLEYIYGDTFSGCTNLRSINMPTELIGIGGGAFRKCRNIVSLSLPSSVRSIGGGAFSGCSELSSVTFGSNSSLRTIGYSAFVGSIIIEIDLGENVNDIGNYAFYNVTSLRKVICRATTPPTLGSWAFWSTPATIYVPDASVSTYKTTSQWENYADRIVGISQYNNSY